MTLATPVAELSRGLQPKETIRERLLLPSPSGRAWCVVEAEWSRIELALDDLEEDDELAEELAWSVDVHVVSGWYPSAARAGRQRARLEREGRWLSAECRAWLRSLPPGALYRLSELRWEG